MLIPECAVKGHIAAGAERGFVENPALVKRIEDDCLSPSLIWGVGDGVKNE